MKIVTTHLLNLSVIACFTFATAVNTVNADEDSKIEARIEKWGGYCKNKVAEKFDAPMSDIHVSVGATERTSIDAGEITLTDIKEYGLSFNWQVKSQGETASGYCNTDGEGNIVEFEQ